MLPPPRPTALVSNAAARLQRKKVEPCSAKGRRKERPFHGPVFLGEAERANKQPPCKSNHELSKIQFDNACFS